MDSTWEARLDAAEREQCGSPPFEVGERIIALDAPHYGVATVLKCWLERDHYMVWWQQAGSGTFATCSGVAIADEWTQVPAVWEDAPQPPRLAEEDARLLTWAQHDRTVVEQAREQDIRMGRHHELALFLRNRLAPWWEKFGSMIAPELAREQAANIRAQADRLEEEAGERSAAA